jgi:hypothetical protein
LRNQRRRMIPQPGKLRSFEESKKLFYCQNIHNPGF